MYINKLETLSNERQAFKNNVKKHKLAQLGLMENVGLYFSNLFYLNKKEHAKLLNHFKIAIINIWKEETTPKKQIEFQDTFQIDFRNIDQDLPKSIRPVFSQDGFKIGKAYIEVDKSRCKRGILGQVALNDPRPKPSFGKCTQ